jgi:hypothetical protein
LIDAPAMGRMVARRHRNEKVADFAAALLVA